MTRARRARREWWTFCSPYSDGLDDVPVVDLAWRDDEAVPASMLPGFEDMPLDAHPSTFEERIDVVLADHALTFDALAMLVVNRSGPDAIGSSFEFALWAMVEAGRVKFSPRTPTLFMRSPSTLQPNYERAHDRALERRYG